MNIPLQHEVHGGGIEFFLAKRGSWNWIMAWGSNVFDQINCQMDDLLPTMPKCGCLLVGAPKLSCLSYPNCVDLSMTLRTIPSIDPRAEVDS